MITWEMFVSVIRAEIPDRESAEAMEISAESRLIEDLGYDSISIIELLTQIEECFGVDYTERENFAAHFNVCQDIFEGIQELIRSA